MNDGRNANAPDLRSQDTVRTCPNAPSAAHRHCLRSCNLQLLDSNARHAETAPHLSARLRQQAWIYTRPTAGAPPRIEPVGCVPPRPAASRFNSSSSGVRLKRFASFLSSRHRWELGREGNWTASHLRAVTSSLRRSARSSSAGAPVTAAAATRTLEACEASGMRAGPQMCGHCCPTKST